jgi:hypothetical protein
MITEKKSEPREFKDFLKNVCPLYVIDHAGRAGNGFFQTLFDEHPEVLSIPWIHYCTSYFVTEFGDENQVESRKAHEFWSTKSYFRFFYAELSKEDYRIVHRFGGNPETPIDRLKIRQTFDQIILRKNSASRKEVIYASFYAIAIALGRDVEKIKFLVLTDSISLRSESVFRGFSGCIIDYALKDTANARFIHLIRDPRAGFASTNHQFVNQLGNMYALDLQNARDKFMQLIRCQLSMESPFVFGFWILYFLQTFRAIERKKKENQERFVTVRNEDLNLHFVRTIKNITQKLNVAYNLDWDCDDYSPTMLGHPWKGTGGYSNRYQTMHTGPLQNDSDKISQKVTGPNLYVTERWKKRLSKNEKKVLDYYFAEEIMAYKYNFILSDPDTPEFASYKWEILKPLRGEIPSFKWLYIHKKGLTETVNRVFYYFALPIFYSLSRFQFFNNKRIKSVLEK